MMSDVELPCSLLWPVLPPPSSSQERRSWGMNNMLDSSWTPRITLSVISANLTETPFPDINARNPYCGFLTNKTNFCMIQGHSLWPWWWMGPARVEDLFLLIVILRICFFSLFDLIWHSRPLSIFFWGGGVLCFQNTSQPMLPFFSGLYICISACILLNSFSCFL